LKQILIAGGSGLVGTSLTRRLKAKGYKVAFLGRKSRKSVKGVDKYTWDVHSGYIDPIAFENTEVVINLSGAGVADKRWNSKRKKEIYNSRIKGTQLLNEGISKYGKEVNTVISASAIGYYGDREDEILFEESYAGDDFLANTCKEWETEAEGIKSINNKIRLCILRIGLVLTNRGGYFAKIKRPIKWGLGAAPSPGTQYQSWIHMDDLCHCIIYLTENPQVEGTFNAVAPEPVTADVMIANIAQRFRKPYFLPPIPSWIMHLMFGEMADTISSSQYVNSEKLRATGFRFKYADLNTALNNLILE
jgi:uncharacterized protein (TIGR01777 family)